MAETPEVKQKTKAEKQAEKAAKMARNTQRQQVKVSIASLQSQLNDAKTKLANL